MQLTGQIKLNGKEISKQFVIQFIKRNKPFFETNSLSFFEMTVGLAFDYFAKQKVDIAVIEVGLGGRLDSTNIITPEVSVITNIGLDHVQFLGNTLESIANEKGGIIKSNIPVVIGETQNETKNVFKRIALVKKAKIIFADKIKSSKYDCDLKGAYQDKNIKTAVQSIRELQLKQYKISEEDIKYGLLNVVKNTGLLGRWQILKQSPKVICDTAHNREGLEIVLKQLQREKYKQLHIVFGVVNDKNLETIADLLPINAKYYLCKPNIPRGLDSNKLKLYFNDQNLISNTYNSVNEAYKKGSEEHTSELQSRLHLVCRLLLEKKKQ